MGPAAPLTGRVSSPASQGSSRGRARDGEPFPGGRRYRRSSRCSVVRALSLVRGLGGAPRPRLFEAVGQMETPISPSHCLSSHISFPAYPRSAGKHQDATFPSAHHPRAISVIFPRTPESVMFRHWTRTGGGGGFNRDRAAVARVLNPSPSIQEGPSLRGPP